MEGAWGGCSQTSTSSHTPEMAPSYWTQGNLLEAGKNQAAIPENFDSTMCGVPNGTVASGGVWRRRPQGGVPSGRRRRVERAGRVDGCGNAHIAHNAREPVDSVVTAISSLALLGAQLSEGSISRRRAPRRAPDPVTRLTLPFRVRDADCGRTTLRG